MRKVRILIRFLDYRVINIKIEILFIFIKNVKRQRNPVPGDRELADKMEKDSYKK